MPTVGPPELPQCPNCGGTYGHVPGCVLEILSIDEAAGLGFAAALDKVRRLEEEGRTS